jgi:hypothetical protein
MEKVTVSVQLFLYGQSRETITVPENISQNDLRREASQKLKGRVQVIPETFPVKEPHEEKPLAGAHRSSATQLCSPAPNSMLAMFQSGMDGQNHGKLVTAVSCHRPSASREILCLGGH